MLTTPRAPSAGTDASAAFSSIRAYDSLSSKAPSEDFVRAFDASAKRRGERDMIHDANLDAASESTSSEFLHPCTARHIRRWSANVRDGSSPPASVLLVARGRRAAGTPGSFEISSSAPLIHPLFPLLTGTRSPRDAPAIETPNGRRRWIAGFDANTAAAAIMHGKVLMGQSADVPHPPSWIR